MDNVLFAKMDEIVVSDQHNNIVGTSGLATCIGVLIYDEKNKFAIASHIAPQDDISWFFNGILKIIDINNLEPSFKYIIVEGTYEEHYNVKNKLNEFFEKYSRYFIPFDRKDLPIDYVNTWKDYGESANEFAFDSITGRFVTKEIFIDNNYDNILK